MSAQYREVKPMGTYSYSTLNNTSNFTCGQYCMCRNSNERSQFDIDMYNKYVAGGNVQPSCKIPGCTCKNCQCPSCGTGSSWGVAFSPKRIDVSPSLYLILTRNNSEVNKGRCRNPYFVLYSNEKAIAVGIIHLRLSGSHSLTQEAPHIYIPLLIQIKLSKYYVQEVLDCLLMNDSSRKQMMM